jgi:hypothetical protein
VLVCAFVPGHIEFVLCQDLQVLAAVQREQGGGRIGKRVQIPRGHRHCEAPERLNGDAHRAIALCAREGCVAPLQAEPGDLPEGNFDDSSDERVWRWFKRSFYRATIQEPQTRILSVASEAFVFLDLMSRHICKNTEHKPRQQKNVGQKNEDQMRFDRYFSASHFSAF